MSLLNLVGFLVLCGTISLDVLYNPLSSTLYPAVQFMTRFWKPNLDLRRKERIKNIFLSYNIFSYLFTIFLCYVTEDNNI